jgi:ribosomal protein L35
MALKKFRAKTRKAVVKRLKVSNGSDLKAGKLIVNRINDNHLNLRKSRKVKLRARRSTTLSKIHDKLKATLHN